MSENSALLPKFIVALSDQGYQRFVDPINNIYPDRGRKFGQEYFEFLINYMKGELADILEPLQICAYLYRNRCIELSDKEAIEATQVSRGRTAACQEMFQAVKQELERTGILLGSTKQRYHSDSTISEEESVKFKSYFQFDVTLRQKFQLQPIKYSDIRDVIITNDQLVFADYARNSLLIYDINGSYNREIKLSSNPLSISVINEDDVAVSYYRGQRIEIININTGKVKPKIGTSGNTGGISYQNGLICAVVDDQNIDVMNMTGKPIQSFECPVKSMERCLSTNTDSLFFTDSFNAILYCCNLNGSYRWKFTYDKMPNLTEVTTDRDGNVYLACYDSNNVIVVSSDGKYRK
ncbi:AASDH [Mytilus coruscus]|uniref:AASDH n=1 Tax=Mytilus coruscus TaxID=42192 RepID=A0A6J8A7F1_MYTCO|nr:AASDH [Mytilus coruscus]